MRAHACARAFSAELRSTVAAQPLTEPQPRAVASGPVCLSVCRPACLCVRPSVCLSTATPTERLFHTDEHAHQDKDEPGWGTSTEASEVTQVQQQLTS